MQATRTERHEDANRNRTHLTMIVGSVRCLSARSRAKRQLRCRISRFFMPHGGLASISSCKRGSCVGRGATLLHVQPSLPVIQPIPPISPRRDGNVSAIIGSASARYSAGLYGRLHEEGHDRPIDIYEAGADNPNCRSISARFVARFVRGARQCHEWKQAIAKRSANAAHHIQHSIVEPYWHNTYYRPVSYPTR